MQSYKMFDTKNKNTAKYIISQIINIDDIASIPIDGLLDKAYYAFSKALRDTPEKETLDLLKNMEKNCS